jgi:redox-sensing transcriptional repressor
MNGANEHPQPYRIDIPDIVIRRLPMYVRSLQILLEHSATESISSDELAEAVGISSAQIRRDLAYFGRFGTQGRGYNARRLIAEINHILGLDRTWNVALCGYGNLGRAIAQYGGFVPSTFRIAAVFDRNEERIGSLAGEIRVSPQEAIPEVLRNLNIKLGIVAVPFEAAQTIADALIEGGVEAILNYAPIHLRAPDSVTIREIDPVGAMQSMTYYISRQQ